MQKTMKLMTTGSLFALGVGLVAMTAASDAAGATDDPDAPAVESPAAFPYGCPSGDFCIYPGPTSKGPPSNEYYYDKCYDLDNVVGVHFFVNNQTGGAKVWWYESYGCNGQASGPIYVGYGALDWTKINSIRLAE